MVGEQQQGQRFKSTYNCCRMQLLLLTSVTTLVKTEMTIAMITSALLFRVLGAFRRK